MDDSNDTSDAVEMMARDLSEAGNTTAADMLRRLLARAQTAEAERDELRVIGLGSSDGSVLSQESKMGESLEEILKGEHQGP